MPEAKTPVEALRALVDKLDLMDRDPSLLGVFSLAAIHGMHYGGPNWAKELREAHAALAAAAEKNAAESA